MAFSYIYRRLFEVRLLHGYYLDQSETEPFWNLNQSQLEEALSMYDIFQDLEISPDVETSKIIRRNRLLFRRTRTGFIVGIEVKEEVHNNQMLSFPFIPIQDELRLRFRLKVRNPFLWSFTQTRLRPTLSAKYYFTNQEGNGSRSYPMLARRTSDYMPGNWYEMGERVQEVGTTNIYEALMKNDTAPSNANPSWSLVDTNYYYLTEEDRSLIPKRVAYAFPEEALVTDATVSLIGASFNKTHTVSDPAQLRKVELNFYDAPVGEYELLVESLNNNYRDRRMVVLDDALFLGHIDNLHTPVAGLPGGDPENRVIKDVSRVGRQARSREASETDGWIEIIHQPDLNQFRLLEDGGYLRMEGTPGNEQRQHPVFEIALRPRISYWHYISLKGYGSVQNVNGDVSLQVVDGENQLVTTRPRPFLSAGSPVRMTYEVPNTNPVTTIQRRLPNPDNFALKEVDQKTKIGSEVFLNRI